MDLKIGDERHHSSGEAKLISDEAGSAASKSAHSDLWLQN